MAEFFRSLPPPACLGVLLLLLLTPSSVRATLAYSQSFETSDGGFTTSGTTSWAWAEITSGPGKAHSAANAWATNPAGDYTNGEQSGSLSSPEIDLSANAGQALLLSWWQYLVTAERDDPASVWVSKDGGATWDAVRESLNGSVSPSWQKQSVFLDASYSTDSFRIRFRFDSDESGTAPGFYVDDINIDMWEVTTIYGETFEDDNGGFSVAGTSGWEWGTPSSGPGDAHSGVRAWATGLADQYDNDTDSYLVSPPIDATPPDGERATALLLSWWQFLWTEGVTKFGERTDFASVEVSSDGTTWNTVYGEIGGDVSTEWSRKNILLQPSLAISSLQVRFRLHSDGDTQNAGFFVDDVELLRTTALLSSPVVALFSARDASETIPGYTDERTLAVTLSGSVEGATITGWQITETDTPPGPGDSAWLAEAPDSYTITGPGGEIILHGWLLSSEGVVSAPGPEARVAIHYEPPLQFAFRLTEGGEERSALHFGTWGAATEAFDPHLDVESGDGGAPDAKAYFQPPPGYGSQRLQADYRPPASIVRWRLVVEVPDSRAPVMLEWDVSNADAEKVLLLQRLRGETPSGAPLDMMAEEEIQILETTVFEAAYGTAHEARVDVTVGWNLVGTPVMTDQAISILFDSALLGAWSWHAGSYSALTDEAPMNAEQGYFVQSAVNAQSRIMRGLLADGHLDLEPGWNLISPVSNGVVVGNEDTVGPVWAWDPLSQNYARIDDDATRSGQAYWVFVLDTEGVTTR